MRPVSLSQEGANAATRNIYTHRHLDLDHCRHWLQTIRAKDTENGIMVVTEGLFSMDSDTPDIAALQDLCHEYNATLLVDVAHDLGALGEDGRGHIGTQKMLGKVDLVMGSFSKTFASNGGFVACRNRAVKEYLRFYSPSATFSNASIFATASLLNLIASSRLCCTQKFSAEASASFMIPSCVFTSAKFPAGSAFVMA